MAKRLASLALNHLLRSFLHNLLREFWIPELLANFAILVALSLLITAWAVIKVFAPLVLLWLARILSSTTDTHDARLTLEGYLDKALLLPLLLRLKVRDILRHLALELWVEAIVVIGTVTASAEKHELLAAHHGLAVGTSYTCGASPMLFCHACLRKVLAITEALDVPALITIMAH